MPRDRGSKGCLCQRSAGRAWPSEIIFSDGLNECVAGALQISIDSLIAQKPKRSWAARCGAGTNH